MDDQVRYWFEQAAGVSPNARAAFLDACCPDEAVRAEVLSLLEYDVEDSGATLDTVRTTLESMIGEDSGFPKPRAGVFKLGRLLGSGGMGFVYEGSRDDGEVRQRVAVKFAHVPPAASESYRESAHRRFARERQVLATLRHPYIAGLIDAGTTDSGIPYAAIEQVDGVPIDAYCDASLPDPADRIRLVLKLCDAVQFAHRNLIVHSDIKPENVLVTADGIPKLIDFGVASDLGEDPTLPTMRAFTPGYASPEQVRGEAATVATDVFGIGAVLYRLLTGAKPWETASGSRGSEQVVRPASIKPQLKGDLENILLKALHCEPHRRYGSVPELADDLNRFLARRPVRATPDSVLYRSGRFVRRHWLALTAVAALVAALVFIAAVSLKQRREALNRAIETRHLAERLMFEVHDELQGVLGATRAREKLGALAVQYLEGLERDGKRDPELAWELLNAYARLAQSRGGSPSSVGDSPGGADLAAKALAHGAVVESAPQASHRLDRLFAVYEGLIPVLLEAGRPADQRAAIDRLLQLAPRLHPVREAQALKQLARYHDANDQPREAAAAWSRTLAILRKLAADPANSAGTAAQLPSALVGFGRAQALAGDFSAAAASLQEAIRLAESRSASEPRMAHAARQLYWSHIGLGDIFGSTVRFSLGRPAEAAAHYRKAQAIAERLLNADPANETARLDLSRALGREAAVLASPEPARALALLDRSHALALQTSARNHSGLDSRYTYLTGSVELLSRLGRFDRARQHLDESRRLAEKMRREGVAFDERNLLKAEEILLDATGQRREALAVAHKHLGMLPQAPRPVLSENFAALELLERIRAYAAGFDSQTCAAAGGRLVRTWEVLRASYPQSDFVRIRAERAKALDRHGCEPRWALLDRGL